MTATQKSVGEQDVPEIAEWPAYGVGRAGKIDQKEIEQP
jgi:hypothetical protein